MGIEPGPWWRWLFLKDRAVYAGEGEGVCHRHGWNGDEFENGWLQITLELEIEIK